MVLQVLTGTYSRGVFVEPEYIVGCRLTNMSKTSNSITMKVCMFIRETISKMNFML